MNGPKHELANVINTFLPELSKNRGISSWQLYILNTLLQCRTPALGGHEDVCTDCGKVSYSYNSCRNRHCPKCQGTDREKWIDAREADLLPVKYFHVVFTVPHTLNILFMHHPQDMYNLLFQTAWGVLKNFGADPQWLGGQPGAIAILHTWTQKLLFHPHLHFIVPAGGIGTDGIWKNSRSNGKFLFRVGMLSAVFRSRFVEGLRKWAGENSIVLSKKRTNQIFAHNWVVHTKQPFSGPNQVIEYLGRYTHRVAISNNRIKEITGDKVTFSYIDRKDNDTKKMMSLTGQEFLRRFIMHIMPYGFTRIRHYGFLSSRNKSKSLNAIRKCFKIKPPEKKQRTWVDIVKQRWGFDPFKCSECGGQKIFLRVIPRQRAPPLPLWKNPQATIKHFELAG
jgi:hypothetical protein